MPDAKIVGKLDLIIGRLQSASSKSHSIRGSLSKTQSEIQHSIDFAQNTRKDLQNLRSDLTSTLNEIADQYHDEIEPLLTEVLSDVARISDQASDKLEKLDKKLPEMQDNL